MIRGCLSVVLGGVLKHVWLVVVVVGLVVVVVVVVVAVVVGLVVLVSSSLVFLVPEGQFGLHIVFNTANIQYEITKKHKYI